MAYVRAYEYVRTHVHDVARVYACARVYGRVRRAPISPSPAARTPKRDKGVVGREKEQARGGLEKERGSRERETERIAAVAVMVVPVVVVVVVETRPPVCRLVSARFEHMHSALPANRGPAAS